MAKVSEKKKVKLLEDAVLSGNIDEVKNVINAYGHFEFAARAFGLACAFADLETVQLLAENGCTFSYEQGMDSTYKAGKRVDCAVYSPHYSVFPAYRTDAVRLEYHLGILPETEKHPNDPQQRTAILEFLLKDPKRYGMDLSRLLFYAVLWRNKEVVSVLRNHGISLERAERYVLTSTDRYWKRDDLAENIQTMDASELIYVLKTYEELLKTTDEKFAMTQGMIERRTSEGKKINELLLEPEVLTAIVETADTKGLKKSAILEFFAWEESLASLEIAAKAGWIHGNPQKDKLMQYAAEHQKTAVLAWLTDYNAKTTDPVKEQKKEAQRIQRALNTTVSPTAELKKLWNYKKLEDGTLEITGYKGKETEITVPAQIGKDSVTVIGFMAFDPHSPRVRNSWERHHIECIFLPEGILKIEPLAFASLGSLKKVTLPGSIVSIDDSAFMSTNLSAGAKMGAIYAPAGSYAESYAKINNIPFVAE